MAKKKKTLPKNFKELVEAKDIEALKAVFADCEPNATNGYDRHTALHFYDIPAEFVRWLAGQGADLNARDRYDRTPLDRYATVGSDIAAVLLELGADPKAKDKYGNTPLHAAAGFHRTKSTRALVSRGADVGAENDSGRTPLAHALARCQNADIANMAEVADILLAAGAKVTPGMAGDVGRIGKDFEFFRADFDKGFLAGTCEGLARLYALFGVAPAPRRLTHDGVSPIVVPGGPWRERHDALWQSLVPGKGAAKTVQGEAIRASGRLAHEILDTGGANWDADFRRMLSALVGFFKTGEPLPAAELSEASRIEGDLAGGGGGEGPGRLMELAVRWVGLNPASIPLGKPKYKR
jgi:hypothetical protein